MIRRDPITGDRILFAPARAARPSAFGADETGERCPFCPGNESDTPPTIASIGDPWRVRVFANKYPSVEGAEVIVDSPDHDATFDRIDHAEDAVAMYLARYRAHERSAYTAVFRNHGARAGASIAHVHAQVMPLPFTPPRIARESAAFARAESCPLCKVEGTVLRETPAFVWLAPHGSRFAYQSWIVPRRHVAEMSAFDAREQAELATLLRAATGAMLRLNDAHNWMFMNFPREPKAHCYVELIPRLTSIAGFELGTGTFVEIIDPAAAASRLKD